MHRNWSKIAVAALLSSLMVATAFGQMFGNDQIERLRGYLELTDEIVQNARDAVLTAHNPVAEQTLARAVNQQEQAWGMYRQTQYRMSYGVAQRARELAKSALTAARQSRQYEGFVLRHLERTDELMERVHERITAGTPELLRSLYRNAEEKLDRAWEFYRNGQYRPAVKLADQVEKAARRLIGIANGEHRGDMEFERRRLHVEDLMEQARSAVTDCASGTGHQFLEQAEKALELSLQLADEGRSEASLQSLQRTRTMAMRAMRACQGEEELGQRYQQLMQQLERMRERLGETTGGRDQAVVDLLDQMERQLEQARKQLESKKMEAALASLHAAQLAYRKAQGLLEAAQ
jgi:hypothetical protein